jgi:4-amino-4-deoxy-L-arabinose transferase-like glycosyltransferase
MLATCPMFLPLSTIITIDMFFSLWITAAILGFVYGLRLPSHERMGRSAAILSAYFFLGLGFLTKGPVVLVVPGLLWLCWRPRESSWLPPRFLAGTAIFALVVLPWFLLASSRFPAFLEFFFLRGHLSRFLGVDPGQVNVHEEPFYYYLPYVVAGAFPWSFYLPLPGKKLWAKLKSSSDSRFLWGWLAPGFLFFSVGAGKLPTYVLPLFPAIALLAAERWEELAAGAASVRRRIGSAGVVCVAALATAVVGLLYICFQEGETGLDPLDRRLVFWAAAIAVFFSISSLVFHARGRSSAAFAALIVMLIGASVVGSLIKLPFDEERSMEDVARKLKGVRKPGDVLVCVNKYFPIFSFYLEEPVLIQGNRGELAFGSKTLGERPDLFVEWDRIRTWVVGPERLFLAAHQSRRARIEAALGTKLYLLEKRSGQILLSDQKDPWPEPGGGQEKGERAER